MSAVSGVWSVTTSLCRNSSSRDTYSTEASRATVIGQHPAAESTQPVDHRRADAPCPDHPDRHVAEFSSADARAVGSRAT